MERVVNTARLMLAIAVLLYTGACAQQSPQARITEATMARGADEVSKEPIERTDTYTKWTDAFTCCVDVSGVFGATHLKSAWYYHEAGTPVLIDTTVIRVSQDSWVAFTLTHGGVGWPYGEYTALVTLSGDGNESVGSKELSFTVKPGYPGPELTEIVLSDDVNEAGYPIAPTTELQPTIEPVYACVYLNEPAAMHSVAAKWYQVFEGEDDYLMSEASLQHGDPGWLMFSLTPATPLPAGAYYVTITLDGEPVGTESFQVR